MKQTDFAKTLTRFLAEYIPGQRNLSANTVKSYRDTFKLLLTFFENELGIKSEHVTFSEMKKSSISMFLEWLQSARKASISTRNQRLAVIHSFYRYAQVENPELLLECQRVLSIPFRKSQTKPLDYLTVDALKAVFEQPDTKSKKERRDLVLMVTLYDTGARVQELIDIKVKDVRIACPAVISLIGKGNKKRYVPIMSKTLLQLKNYIRENKFDVDGKQDQPLFFNSQNRKFTRPGITYILKKYFTMAKELCGDVAFPEKITPHMFRHSKAMHLLDAGVNLIYIRDFLGHVNVTTTEIYAKANSDLKRRALESAYVEIAEDTPPWREDKDLLNWLQNFCR